MSLLRRLMLSAVSWVMLLAPLHAESQPASVPLRKDISELISVEEFRQLAEDLAPKVNLFADAWELDPKAEFYGGTTRDYLYWIIGKFKGVRTREGALATMAELRRREHIDVRSFIIGESDVDISSARSLDLHPEHYGVKKVDSISFDRFDPASVMGKNELQQGVIPAEKIRLGRSGFVRWEGVGDGLAEIHGGKLSIRFAPREVFAQTHYAKLKLNHPVLQALRFLRLQAINYFQRYGRGYPDLKALLDMDPASAAAVRQVIGEAALSGELKEYLAVEKFRDWMNATIRKGFLSYTNPTAMKVLLDEFGVPDLLNRHPEIRPYNQFLFEPYREPAVIQSHLARAEADWGLDRERFFGRPERFFPDGELYHGTRTPEAYRAILFQGVLPSEGGNAGDGLYGVAKRHLPFAIDWGGSEDRVARFDVSKSARIVDITEGEGKRIWERFKASYPEPTETRFAEHFGIDILRYPYGNTEAFVVKNSGALSRPRGYKLELLSVSKLLERAAEVRTMDDLQALAKLFKVNFLSRREVDLVLGTAAKGARDATVRNAALATAALFRGEAPAAPEAKFVQQVVPELLGTSPSLDETIARRLLPLLQTAHPQDFDALLRYFRSKMPWEVARFLSLRSAEEVAGFVQELRSHQPKYPRLIQLFSEMINDSSSTAEAKHQLTGLLSLLEGKPFEAVDASFAKVTLPGFVRAGFAWDPIKQPLSGTIEGLLARDPALADELAMRLFETDPDLAWEYREFFEAPLSKRAEAGPFMRIVNFVRGAFRWKLQLTEREFEALSGAVAGDGWTYYGRSMIHNLAGDGDGNLDRLVAKAVEKGKPRALSGFLEEKVRNGGHSWSFSDKTALGQIACIYQGKPVSAPLNEAGILKIMGAISGSSKEVDFVFRDILRQFKGQRPDVYRRMIRALTEQTSPLIVNTWPEEIRVQWSQVAPEVRSRLGLEGSWSYGTKEFLVPRFADLLRRYAQWRREGGFVVRQVPEEPRFASLRKTRLMRAVEELERAFSGRWALSPGDLERLRTVAAMPVTTPGSMELAWLEKHAKELVRKAVDLPYAHEVLDSTGLKAKLLTVLPSDVSVAGSSAWWLKRPHLPNMPSLGAQAGRTSKELGIWYVVHGTDSPEAFRSITRHPSGVPNFLASSPDFPGLTSFPASGHFTHHVEDWGKSFTTRGKYQVAYRVDPSAREGVDFARVRSGSSSFDLVWLNSSKLKVLNLSPDDALLLPSLAEDLNSRPELVEALKQVLDDPSAFEQPVGAGECVAPALSRMSGP